MDFDNFDWKKTAGTWEKWWDGKLGRPIFFITGTEGPAEDGKGLPVRHFTSQYDFSIPAGEILLNYEEKVLKKRMYHGDAFPSFWPNFGPGVLAAFTGGEGRNEESTVWFYPGRFENSEIKDISVKLDKSSPWFRRVEEFFIAAADVWKGKVAFGMTDLGGTLDVMSSFLPGEKLILDLYDSPDGVNRLTWEIHEAWWEAYEHFESIIKNSNVGYGAWTPLLSQSRYYMLQCDFSYMLSPDMFGEFVKPELAASCRRLSRAFYHLDGKGELPHLKHLYSIPELAGIQWVPGEGMPHSSEWPEVLKEIIESGRKLQVGISCVEEMEKIISYTDKPEAIAFVGSIERKDKKRLLEFLKQYGIE
ncbi:MAG: hypothetical protein A2017_11945 [Lentisphaerae bacterium GWF2_44_16]|nr:MAG: hypothetical protein A2017_11945 [Lentisphaerae bacterium GWF2_44_16]